MIFNVDNIKQRSQRRRRGIFVSLASSTGSNLSPEPFRFDYCNMFVRVILFFLWAGILRNRDALVHDNFCVNVYKNDGVYEYGGNDYMRC